jgi:hypothetical protein
MLQKLKKKQRQIIGLVSNIRKVLCIPQQLKAQDGTLDHHSDAELA